MNYQLFREHLGGRHALSRWSLLLAFPLGVLAYFATNFFDDPARNALHVAAVVLAQTAAAGVGLLVWWIRRRDRRTTPRPLLMLLGFAGIGATRGLLINVFLELLGDPAPYGTGGRVALGVVLGVVGLSLVAVATSLNRASREAQRNLAEAAGRIEQYQRHGEERIRQTESQVLETVRGALEQAIVQVELAGARHPKRAADALERLSTDIIRPLSHDIVQRASLAGGGATPGLTPTPSPRHGLAEVLSHSRPAPVGLSVALLAPVIVLFFVGGMGVTPGSIVAVSTIATYTVASILLKVAVEQSPHTHGSVIWNLLGALAVAMITLAQASWMVWWLTGSLSVFWFGGVLIVAVAVAITLARAHIDWQRSNEQNLAEALRDSSSVAADWAQRSQARLEHMAHVLHSTIQSELVAQVWQLRRGTTLSSDPVHALQDLMNRLDDLFASPPPAEPEDASVSVARLVQLWRSARSIDLVATPEVWDALNRSREGLDRVELVIGEALTNAVRHGGPGLLSVTLKVIDPSQIVVEVTNPGFVSANRSSDDRWSDVSLGLRRISSASERWELRQLGPVVQLTAWVTTQPSRGRE